MEEIQSWFASYSSSSQETHSTPSLCEDTSFNSLDESNSSNYSYCPIKKSSISHHCIASFRASTPQINSLAVHNHTNTLYAASTNGVNVFDLTSYSLIETFGSGSGSVKSIAFSEDDRIFTSHQDCKIRVWKMSTTTNNSNNPTKHQHISTLPTLKERVLKSMFPKNYVQVRRHKQKLWIEHADAVSGLAVNNGAGLMYSVSWDKCLKIWKLNSSDVRCLESMKAHSDAVNAIAVSPCGGTVYTGSADGCIKVWKCDKRKVNNVLEKTLVTLVRHETSVNALALSSDGVLLYSGGGDKVVIAWKWDDEKSDMFVKCCFVGHRGAVLCLVNVNGFVISGSSDKTVRIWKHGCEDYSSTSNNCLAVLEGHSKPVKSLVAVSGTGGDDDDDHEDGGDTTFSVFSGSLDGEIRVWKIVNC